jgi:hypothetical protein
MAIGASIVIMAVLGGSDAAGAAERALLLSTARSQDGGAGGFDAG